MISDASVPIIIVCSILKVRVGSNYGNKHGLEVRIKNIKTHPQYNSTTHENDVAVIKLKKRLTFSKNIQPIELLLERTYTLELRYGTLTGYGVTQGSEYFTPLVKVDLEIIDYEYCKKLKMPTLTEDKLCGRFIGSRGKCLVRIDE